MKLRHNICLSAASHALLDRLATGAWSRSQIVEAGIRALALMPRKGRTLHVLRTLETEWPAEAANLPEKEAK
jgi:hypothetical protein